MFATAETEADGEGSGMSQSSASWGCSNSSRNAASRVRPALRRLETEAEYQINVDTSNLQESQ